MKIQEEEEWKEERAKEKSRENKVASCVSQFSQLRHLRDNPTVHIEDLWVENDISKFQLNPTVDEVAMIIFPKGVCPAPGQRLASAYRRQKPEENIFRPFQRLASACRRQTRRKQHKTRFFSVFLIPLHSLHPQLPNFEP